MIKKVSCKQYIIIAIMITEFDYAYLWASFCIYSRH